MNEAPVDIKDDVCTQTALVINEHNFSKAKANLKRFTEQGQKTVELSTVDTASFIFFNHKVTGDEFNVLVEQLQDGFKKINNLNMGLVKEFGEVHNLFEALDKDYIKGIVASIKAAEKVSIEEQKDRENIKRLVEQHRKSIEVLKKFKEAIDQLKHVTDIDKGWERLEALDAAMAPVIALKHLKAVDATHETVETLKSRADATDKMQAQQAEAMKQLHAQWEADRVAQAKAFSCRMKVVYGVAGGAVILTVTQLILGLVGVL